MPFHLARYGQFGYLGLFQAVDAAVYPRNARVVLRTPRGLEIGRVVAPPDDLATHGPADGQILRHITAADDLLAERLARRRDDAFVACQALLAAEGIETPLIDVEHLLDGEKLYFYFLGDPPPQAAEITDRLASTYEAAVEFRKFAETLAEGCGPGCGEEKAGDGGCSSCGGCAVASACGAK